ncbi:MAG: hypothetical protein ACR2LE_09320 [Nocardioidaceae bacterium]
MVGGIAPATAAGWHGISGTTYSGCEQANQPTWFTSSNARYKDNYGGIYAKFTSIAPNGLGFKVLDSHNATIGQVKYWTQSETDYQQRFASGVSNGKKFYNSFRETGTGCNTNNHEFVGSEYY